MSTLASLNIQLGANSAVLRKELTRARKATTSYVAQAKKQLSSLARGSVALGKNMGRGILAGTATLGAGVYAVKRTLKSIDEIRRQAANVSMPVEQYQAYAFATRVAGLESEQFADVIKDLNAKVTDFALTGGGAMADFFKVTGQSVQEWQQLQPAQQFERFTQEINKMSQSQARFWLDEINDSASQMFGTLVGNKGEFAANVKLAQDLGLVMSQDVIAGVKATHLEINTLGAMLGGAWQHLVAAAAPAIKYVTEGLRAWLTDTAKASGGFANLGKTLANSILTAVQTSIQSLSQLFYQVNSATYKIAGEHNAAYIIMQRNVRNLNNVYKKQARDYESNLAAYQKTKAILKEVENGTRSLSQVQQQQARQFIAEHEQSLYALGRTGMQLENLEQQLTEFEQQEGITAPFTNALSTIKKLKSEIANVKVDLSGVTPPVTPDAPEYKPQTVVANPFAAQIKQAQQYYETKRLMREQDWSEERAQLAIKLSEYAKANDQKVINDEQYRLLATQATEQYNATQLQQNQGFLSQLKAQVAQTSTDYQTMWGNTFDRFTQGIGESVANAVMTQQSFSDSMKSVMRGVVKSTIAALAEMAAKRLAVWAIEKLLNKTTAAGAAGLMTTQAQAMAMIAGLNAFASTAAIPIVGPPAAPAAMASALAVTQPMAAAITGISAGMVGMAHNGIESVPREGTWLLDKGERVYTNESAAKLDAMYNIVNKLASAQQSSQAAQNSYHFTMSVDALDAAGFDEWFENKKDDILRDVQERFDRPI
jgi:predicted RecA/RadA family phage recombinase